VKDRQTDRQTDRPALAIPRSNIARYALNAWYSILTDKLTQKYYANSSI